MKIHGATRNRELVDILHSLGMCVSYDRLLQLTSDIANNVCQRFSIENAVCPSNLRQGLLTTAAVDNIDYNPSSATAKDSFHGTRISLIQHPSHTNGGLDRAAPAISGPATIQRLSAPGLPMSPIAPPDPFTMALFCS